MKSERKRFHSFLYSPGTRGFHVTVRLRDLPGALASVLNLLGQYVDLTNTLSYSTSGGKAISSVFAKALSKSVTEETLRSAISKSKYVEEFEVVGSKGGLVTDSFHSGVELGPSEPLITMSIRGAINMFNGLAKAYGTGGETILFEEGLALGRANGGYIKGVFGARFVKTRMKDLAALYGTMGWGRTKLTLKQRGAVITARVDDCFECSIERSSRKGCAFRRGHLTGIISSFLGSEVTGEETKCRLRGDSHCEFLLTRKQATRKGHT